MIYFVQATDGGPIKIGFTDNLDARLKALESHYGRPLALLHAMEGGRAEEAETHDRFSHLRIGRTEQFMPGPDLMEFIGRTHFFNLGDVLMMEGTSCQVVVKGSKEWRDWVMALSRFSRMRVPFLIDHALIEYAKRHGFEPPAPKR